MKNLSHPSKKIAILALIAFAIVGFMVFDRIRSDRNKNSAYKNVSYSINTEEISNGSISSIDQNKDGIPDWKEMLLSQTENNASSTDESNDPKTLTDAVARDLFASTVYLTNNGQSDISQGDQGVLVNNLVGKLQNAFVYKEYKIDNLNIDLNTDLSSLREYAIILAAYQTNLILDMQVNVDKIQNDLGVLGEIYAKHADLLYSMKIPSVLADKHLAIINNFSKGAAAFDVFKREKEDPILIPLALRTYQDASSAQDLYLRDLAQYFKDNGIIFSQDEIGGYWNSFETR